MGLMLRMAANAGRSVEMIPGREPPTKLPEPVRGFHPV